MAARAAPSADRRTTGRPGTVADLIDKLGGIPPDRIRLTPPPGTATEADLAAAGKPTCELVDGTLVEKPMGSEEAFLGARLLRLIGNTVEADGLGVVLGGDGHIRLGKGRVRAPDVTFIPWDSFPDGEFPDEAFWTVAPGLVVEVLSPTNTPTEIARKRAELFAAGCKLAWVIDPPTRTAKVYTSARRAKDLDAAGVLDGGRVLPGFALPLAELFAPPARPKRKGR
ncbi:MAG TPA: Uma2 family endonuclease [Urbifossiella sp.]|jgi:Uma2 family endonuclease|nr:Uma2 family endonuclease [Urbifossiella sp.]